MCLKIGYFGLKKTSLLILAGGSSTVESRGSTTASSGGVLLVTEVCRKQVVLNHTVVRTQQVLRSSIVK